MNYETFRSLWSQTLGARDLKLFEHTIQETMDTVSLKRSYRALVRRQQERSAPSPFSVSAELTWDWDALLTARFATTEEDMLTEVFGRKRRPKNTLAPWLRLDVRLLAMVQGDGFYPFPGSSAWRDWAAMVFADVSPHFPNVMEGDPEMPSVVSWCQEPEIQLTCSAGGQLYLLGASLAAAQIIHMPRQWDDTQRRPDPDPQKQLIEFFRRVQSGLEAWQGALDELLTTRSDG